LNTSELVSIVEKYFGIVIYPIPNIDIESIPNQAKKNIIFFINKLTPVKKD
jgi:hypothetical protein